MAYSSSCPKTLPSGYLCPTVPSRANYVHCVGDLLAEDLHNIEKQKAIQLSFQKKRESEFDPPRGDSIVGFDM